MNEEKTVMVSVMMPVYNHEKYIAKAIDGVLMQKTNFRFELIIGEDYSTDHSRSIICRYQKQYPDIIKVIYQPKNQGMRDNIKMIFEKANGRYWAFCEGDDYWTDCNKLQKQVDFLETHPNFSAVYHNVLCVDEKERPCKRKSINKYPEKPEQSFTFEDVKRIKLVGQSASLLFRNLYKVIAPNLYENCVCNGDQKICAVMACIGDIYYMKDFMACHRVVLNKGCSWSAKTYQKNINLYLYNSYNELCRMIQNTFGKSFYDNKYTDDLRKSSFICLCRETTFKNMFIWLTISLKYFGSLKRYLMCKKAGIDRN